MTAFTILASPYTELFWNVYQIDPKRSDYNIVIEQMLNEKTDVARLKDALHRFVVDHPLFDAHLALLDNTLHWCQNAGVVPLQILETTDALDDFCSQPFELDTGPLYRFGLYQREDDQYHFVFCVHHVLIDGLSGMDMVDRITRYYAETDFRLDIDLQAIEQNNRALHEKIRRLNQAGATEHWQRVLEGFPPTNELSQTLSVVEDSQQQVGEAYFRISYEDWNAWNQDEYLQKRVFSVLIAAWAVVVCRLSCQTKAHINFPMSIIEGQPFEYGAHINTLVYPVSLDETVSFHELVTAGIQHLKSLKVDDDTHFGYLPTPAILKATRLQALNVGFAQTQIDNKLMFPEEIHNPEGYVQGHDLTISGDELSLEYAPTPKGLSFRLAYRADKWTKDQAQCLIEYYPRFLERVLKAPHDPVAGISFLSTQEQAFLSTDQHQIQPDYLYAPAVHQSFSLRAAETPDATALIAGDLRVSYQELEETTNRLARLILRRVERHTPQPRIALCFEPGIEMLYALIACMKANTAFLAISPQYPPERANFMLKDSEACLLMSAGNIPLLEDLDSVDHLDISEAPQHTQSNAPLPNATDDVQDQLAYIIYTSGTTGTPKGIKVSHRGLTNLIHYLVHEYPVLPHDRLMLFAPLVFDASIEQIWNPLVSGAELHILSRDEVLDPKKLSDKIQKDQITQLDCTPTFLRAIAPYVNFSGLRRVVVGGESYRPFTLPNFQGQLINTYGPSETTITATAGEVDEDDNFVSIGRPVPNAACYVLDSFGQLVPLGCFGELYIAGAGVSQGYINLPDVNDATFIDNPFADASTPPIFRRLYRTGDIVRWRKKHQLEFLGRKDEQVKIRGFRVELAAIETVMQHIGGIHQAAVDVVQRGDAHKLLVAYYVSDNPIDDTYLHCEIANHLPSHMVPHAFIQVDAIPISANGKVDRAKLPEYHEESHRFTGPRNDLEQRLCHAWQTVLGIQSVSIHDNFFELGADSISLIKVSAELHKSGFHCNTKTINDYPTVAKLAYHLHESTDDTRTLAEQGVLSGCFELLPIQQRFFAQQLTNPNHYNHAFMIEVPALDLEQLTQAVKQLSERHDALRLVFEESHQCYLEELRTLDIHHLNCEGLEHETIQQTLSQWQNHFTLAQGPLWCIGYLEQVPSGGNRLFFAAHHLIMDVISWSILRNDLYAFYHHQSADRKTTSYRQWCQALHEFSASHTEMDRHWATLLATDPWKSYSLPLSETVTEEFCLLEEPRASLLSTQSAQTYHCHSHDLILSALALAINDVFHLNNCCISFETHGRTPFHPWLDASQTVGWFTNLFPLQIRAFDTIRETIIWNKESRARHADNQLTFGTYYFTRCEDTQAYPLPVINYNYLGTIDKDEHPWSIKMESAGDFSDRRNRSSTVLDINVIFMHEKMVIRLDSFLEEPVTRELGTCLTHHLNRIIAHCDEQQEHARSIFTPSDFPGVQLDQASVDALTETYRLENIFIANSLQQIYLEYYQRHQGDGAYHLQLLWELDGPFDPDAYRLAWNAAIEYYEGLRVCFTRHQGTWLQIITAPFRIDWRTQPADSPEKQWLDHDRSQPFDLTQPGLMRITHAVLAPDKHRMMLSIHHCIIDGWSLTNLLAYVHKAYQNRDDGQPPAASPNQAYADTQQHYLSANIACYQYWQEKIDSIMSLPKIQGLYDAKASPPAANEFLQLNTKISPQTLERIQETAARYEVTVNALCHFAWQKLINLTTQSRVTMTATTIAGRDLPITNLDASVGMFINSLPIVMDWYAHTKISTCLKSIQRDINAMNSYSFYPLSKLESAIGRVIYNLFVFENYPVGDSGDEQSETRFTMKQVIDLTGFALTCRVTPMQDGLDIVLIHRTDAVSPPRAQWMLDTLVQILETLPEIADKTHYQLDPPE